MFEFFRSHRGQGDTRENKFQNIVFCQESVGFMAPSFSEQELKPRTSFWSLNHDSVNSQKSKSDTIKVSAICIAMSGKRGNGKS